MAQTKESTSSEDSLIPGSVIGLVAIICAAALIVIAVLGPAIFGFIHYRTSQSGIWQTQAFDITDLILLTPILLIGGTTIVEEECIKVLSDIGSDNVNVRWG